MFRRRSHSQPDEPEETSDDALVGADAAERETGPWDSDALPDDGLARVDLGSLRVAPRADAELRLQVDEGSGEVQ
jgi:hypothetical protein